MKLRTVALAVAFALVCLVPAAQANPANARLTNDVGGGYVSDYTLVTGQPYTDPVLTACGQSRGRQNEPAVAVDPRNPQVIVGSSNDYCGVFAANGSFIGLGNVWLGYYRSENGGASFTSSLVPGYQGDTSPYAARAHVRTADSGDPVWAWDSHGRLFAGSESSVNAEKPTQTAGDVWVATYANPGGENGATSNDGKEFVRLARCRSGLGCSRDHGCLPRQDRNRGRPHRRLLRRERVLRVGAVHWGWVERLQLERLLRALH